MKPKRGSTDCNVLQKKNLSSFFLYFSFFYSLIFFLVVIIHVSVFFFFNRGSHHVNFNLRREEGPLGFSVSKTGTPHFHYTRVTSSSPTWISTWRFSIPSFPCLPYSPHDSIPFLKFQLFFFSNFLNNRRLNIKVQTSSPKFWLKKA